MPEENKNQKIEHRLTKLETQVGIGFSELKEDIRSIKDNHLNKIYAKLESQKNLLISTLITTIILVIGVLFQVLTR